MEIWSYSVNNTAVFHVIMYLHFYVAYMFQPIFLGHHQVLLVYFVSLTFAKPILDLILA